MKNFLQKFRSFSLRGRGMDMSVGVIMAFLLCILTNGTSRLSTLGHPTEATAHAAVQ